MWLYDLSLVAHFLGLIGLFGGFVVYHRALPPLRGASTVSEARAWFDLLSNTRPMIQGGLGFLLVSGVLMAYLRWRGAFPWMVVALIGLFVIGGLTGGVSGRWLERVGKELSKVREGAIPHGLSELLAEPAAWTATAAANGVALSMLWIMTAKPGWGGSLGVMAVAAGAGGLLGARVQRGERQQGTVAHPGT